MKKLNLSKDSLRVLTSQEADQIGGGNYVPTRSPYECHTLQAACFQSARCQTNNCTISVSGP
jgi:hypothetical protein